MAQAQVTRISNTESLELVRCLLRVSIHHLTALRGLFPESYYSDRTMRNLDGINIKVLNPKDDESKRLVDWVDGGVYDAVKKGYLKQMIFGIALDMHGTQLLEEYVYSFSYGECGELTMDIDGVEVGPDQGSLNKNIRKLKTTRKPNNTAPGCVNTSTVRYQVTRLMRCLVTVCNTLQKVPDERYLFCRLVYHDHTPEDYEPDYFRSMRDDEKPGHFARKPFIMGVGNTSTAYHQVKVTVRSVLDDDDMGHDDLEGYDEDIAKDCPEDTMANIEPRDQVQHMPTGGVDPQGWRSDRADKSEHYADHEDLDGEDLIKAMPAAENMRDQQDDYYQNGHESQGEAALSGYHSDDITTAPEDDGHQISMALYSSIRDFCSRMPQVGVEDLMGQFLDITAQEALGYLHRLREDGILQLCGPGNIFRMVEMKGMALVSSMGDMEVNDFPSDAAGIQLAGSDITRMNTRGKAGGTKLQIQPKDTAMEEAPCIFMGGSQASAVGYKRQRNSSFVSEPIHQIPRSKAAKGATKGVPGGRMSSMRR